MRNKNPIWLMAGAVCIICFCFGCGQKVEEEKVVARINNYIMTVEDIEDWIKYSPYAGRQNLEELLDLAIEEQVLIQEAQRQGLDKRKSFMETIERYWRQTLIRELLEKETKRIHQGVSRNKRHEALKDWIEGLYKRADIKIYKDVLKKLEKKR